MDREKVLTIGVAVLGGHSGCEGKYELNVDSIRVVNEEDVTQSQSIMALTGVPLSERLTGKKAAANSQEDPEKDEEDGRW